MLLAVLLAGCGGHAKDTDVPEDTAVDADGDGVTSTDDCDDGDAAVGADPAVWYADDDDDGFGDPEHTLSACDAPAGYLADATDCDDGDADVNPDASERCGGTDEDCDGLEDDDDTHVQGTTVYYTDGDNDGYGANGPTARGCDRPSGYATTSSDCDDTDPDVNPGETEVCGDGVDANCNGPDDNCLLAGDVGVDDAAFTLVGASSEGAGTTLADLGDLSGDTLPDLAVGAPGWGADGQGRIYVVTEPVSGAYDLADAAWIIEGAPNQSVGDLFAAAPDLDGDGLPELVVEALDRTPSTLDFLSGRPSGASTTADAFATRTGWEDHLSAFAFGDVDEDGLTDLVAGAPADGSGGVVYLIPGPLEGETGVADAPTFVGTAGDDAGTSLALGDADGDGTTDILIGLPGRDNGAAVLVEGPLTGGSLATGDALLVGNLYNSRAGWLVALADLNGDGRDDLVITDPSGGSSSSSVTSGLVHILYSRVSGTITLGESVLGDDDATITADSRGCEVGSAIHVADADGDGRADVLVGAPEAYSEKGSVYLLYGPLSGSTSLSDHGARFTGNSDSDPIGDTVLLADRSGDGIPDVLMSAIWAGSGGVVYGFLGSDGS